MPIKPIDLQTLFLQMDRVAKQQSVEKEGAALQQALHGAAVQKKVDESARAVKPVADDQKGAEAVRDKDEGEGGAERREGKRREAEDEDAPGAETVKDPALGGHVDITG